MAVIIQIRRGTAAQWTTANTVLADGEMGYEKDTSKFKFGDGTTAWNALDYIETGGGDAHFLGKYISLAALETAHATAADGDYAIVDAGPGTDAKIYIWDADEGWVEGGGTGASTFADLTGSPTDNAALAAALAARQPIDSDLTAIASLTPTANDFMQYKSGAWANRTPAQAKTDLALAKGDVGLGNVDNTSDANKPVSTAQAAADAAVLVSANGYTDSQISTEVTARNAAISGAIATEVNDRNNAIASAQAGIKWKNSARAATTANITLSGAQTIDGVSLTAGQRVLVKNQTTQTQNGIYVVAAGAWARADDADIASELQSAVVSIEEGSVNGDTTWRQNSDNITIGVTNIVWGTFGSTVADATETLKGVIEIATTLETNTGTDDTRAITPLKLQQQKGVNGGIVGIDGSGNMATLTTDNITEGTTKKYFSGAAVLATVLAGLSTATNAVIDASDTVLSGLGKLQKQITDAIATIAAKATLSEVNAGTTLSKYVSPDTLMGTMKKARIEVANFAIAATDRFGEIVANSATSITGTVNTTLLQFEYVVITNRGVGNVNLVGSGVTLTGVTTVKKDRAVQIYYLTATEAVCIGGSTIDWIDVLGKPTSISQYGITDGLQSVFRDVQVIGNTTTTPTELRKYTMPSNTLSIDGQIIRVRFSGNFAGNANTKTLTLEFGSGVTLFTTGAVAVTTASSWILEVEITRIGATSQICDVILTTSSGALGSTSLVVSAARTLSSAQDIRVVATGTATNDITCSSGKAYKIGV